MRARGDHLRGGRQQRGNALLRHQPPREEHYLLVGGRQRPPQLAGRFAPRVRRDKLPGVQAVVHDVYPVFGDPVGLPNDIAHRAADRYHGVRVAAQRTFLRHNLGHHVRAPQRVERVL